MEHPNPNPPESVSVRHEVRDAAPLPILIFAVSLVATLVLVHLVGLGALNWLQRNQDAEDRIAFPTHPLSGTMSAFPPGPRLEPEPSHDVLPNVDLVEVQTRERALIGPHAWGWLDSSRQFARIPIEQAIKIAVGKDYLMLFRQRNHRHSRSCRRPAHCTDQEAFHESG